MPDLQTRTANRKAHLPMRYARRTTPPALRATSPCTGEAGRFCSVPPPLTQGRLGDVAVCHLHLHKRRFQVLQNHSSGGHAQWLPLPREPSAGTADGGIVKLIQHIKRTTQRLLGGSFLFSCKNQRTMLIKSVWPWLKTCHGQVFGALRRCAACISFTIASIGATNPLSRFYQSSLLCHYNW